MPDPDLFFVEAKHEVPLTTTTHRYNLLHTPSTNPSIGLNVAL